jgi:hypothetical protein
MADRKTRLHQMIRVLNAEYNGLRDTKSHEPSSFQVACANMFLVDGSLTGIDIQGILANSSNRLNWAFLNEMRAVVNAIAQFRAGGF